MGQTWYEAKFKGKCGNCNREYDSGYRILVDVQDEKDSQGRPVMKDGKPKRIYKTVKCDACDGQTNTQQRREDDAVKRSSLPRDIEQMVAGCGTLAEALNLLGNYQELEVSLNAVGRTFKELAMAAVTACLNSSQLPTCEPMSWVIALQGAAASGMIPDPGMGPAAVAYFVPRGGKVSLDLSYRGLCHLAFNGRQVKGHHEEVVWECEVVLGELVSLLRSHHPYEREAGEKLRQQLVQKPDPMLSQWDRDMIALALDRPDGLAYPWFRYQESPQQLLHRRPRWFVPPAWNEQMTTLPWGVFCDVPLVQGGRAIVVLTRDQCYERAVRGGNVRLVVEEKGDKRARLAPSQKWGKWATTPWLRDQGEMMKKTVIRDVMTGGKVPVNVRIQKALAAEIIDGEFTQVSNPAQTLDQHLKTIAAGKPVPETHQIEDQGEAPDYVAEAERLEQREPVPVGGAVSMSALREAMSEASEAQIDAAYEAAGVPSGVLLDDMSSRERERFYAALGGGR